MTIYILITGQKTGRRAVLYEKLGRQGRQALVPTYQAELGRYDGESSTYRFTVTRDSSPVVFGQSRGRFGLVGECPPSRTCAPYRGRLHQSQRSGQTAVMLSESNLAARNGLLGQGQLLRTDIMIHRGPACSLGCLTVGGGRRGYVNWLQALQRLMQTPTEEILVFVEPRPTDDHNQHLPH